MILRFDRLLAGTALGLSLVLSGYSVNAQAPAEAVNGVPVPNTDQLPPPTLKDIEPATAPEPAAAPVAAPAPAAAAPLADPAPAVTAAPAAQPMAPKVAATAIDNTLVVERLRDLVGKSERSFSRKNERSAVEAFYRDRNFEPLWTGSAAAETRARAAIGYLATVDRDGLDPAEYPAPDFKSAGDPESLAAAELKLTASVLTYARHALNGRVAFSRVAADISFSPSTVEPADVLKKLGVSSDIAATLDSLQPQHHAYQALKAKLAEIRGGKVQKEPEKKAEPQHARVPEGRILRPGMKDSRVVALRQRLDVADKDNPLYDAAVADAVKKFQRDNDLESDGNAGPNTVRAMNGAAAAPARARLGDPTDTIIVNLDRWRWFPHELGNTNVVVNVPDYRLTLSNQGKTYWTTKIVVGKPGSYATPMISADMKFITVNPTWNVPPSIIENEYLPALREDPSALDRIGLKVEQSADGTVRIYQPPGAGNALGRIRFNFPNKFLVYQHDTPDKHLFARDKRAFSHGCMRVENPLKYGEMLLSLAMPKENYTQARLEKMFGGSEININFPTSIPVHLTYQTAFVDDDGKLQLREDVYGRDARMIAQLKGSERKVADIAIDRPANSSAKPVRMAPGTYGSNGYNRGGGGGFFDLLFGPPRPAFEPPRRGGRVSSR